MGKGIYMLDSDGSIKLLTNSPILQKNIVINIYPYKNKLLIQTQERGFYTLDQSIVTEWNIKASSRLKSLSIYCSIRLKDGSYALGTIGEGLYILSPDGEIKSHLDKKNGLQNNTILSLFQDMDENIWMGLDNGITIMNYASPFREYFDAKGVFGTVYAAASHDGLLYIGTNQGLFYRPLKADVDFKQIAGLYGQVWTLKVIDKTLFCGHNAGTFIISGNKASKISDILGTWDIKTIENNPNLLIQGNYEGLHILEKANGSWHYRNKIYGFDISSRYFELLPGNKIFVNHEYKGIFELFHTPDFKKITTWHKVPSAPKSYNSGMIKYENRLFYLCNKGVFEYNQQRNQFLKNEILTNCIFQDDMYLSGKLLMDEKQALWAFTGENILHLSAGGIGREPQINRISLPMSLRENVAGFESIIYLSNKEYLLGTTNGYIIFNLDKVNEKEYHIRINSIEKSELNKKGILIAQSKEIYKLKHGENNLSFNFSVPNYDRFTQTSYQYKLEGLDNTWSEWSNDPIAIFKNLPSGNYTFNVRAKVGNKLSSNIATFHFRIAQVWYLSIWMILVYIILFIFILYRINLLYKKKYIEDKNKIEQEQQKELTLIQLENDRTIMNLRNEKLSTEVDAKNRELVSTTMAIVKKNELLNNIKTELLQEKNSPFVKSALQIINNDLENNNDWKAFQEAFDNIDRDFLKKLKDLHCALTPNDLKLCVYLRLNLSSKEIAPLLNISPQSVEVKRFRLRKRIGLDHEQNLAEYILNL
jgi:DNA-binding CsgD family transcriptional regulator